AQFMRRADKGLICQSKNAAPFEHIFTRAIMKLRGTHRVLEFWSDDDFAEKLICLQKYVVVKENVVDADDAFFAQNPVIEIGQPSAHFEANAEMRIVIEIRAGRNNPVYKSRAH